MLVKTITYTDFNGETITEDFYFNLSKSELIEMQVSEDGGYGEMLDRISKSKDGKNLVKEFKNLILKSYGEKSADGKRFVKSNEISTAFSQTNAYNDLFMELSTNDEEAVKFINGVMPDMSSLDSVEPNRTNVMPTSAK